MKVKVLKGFRDVNNFSHVHSMGDFIDVDKSRCDKLVSLGLVECVEIVKEEPKVEEPKVEFEEPVESGAEEAVHVDEVADDASQVDGTEEPVDEVAEEVVENKPKRGRPSKS